jgi:uncharacterized membrane protein
MFEHKSFVMTRDKEAEQQNAAITANSMALLALIDELHEAGFVDRAAVAERLSRVRDADNEPIPVVEVLVENIAAGLFDTQPAYNEMWVLENDENGPASRLE